MQHGEGAPSDWVVRWAGLVPRGRVLDLACGRGRHARYFAGLGRSVLALDRDAEALAALAGVPGVGTLRADLEDGNAWPLAGERFAGIVVTNYLHRPLYPALAEALAPGGVLLYETFMAGNERLGKPSNPKFLLKPGELWRAFGPRLAVRAFRQGEVVVPKPAVIQSLVATAGGSG